MEHHSHFTDEGTEGWDSLTSSESHNMRCETRSVPWQIAPKLNLLPWLKPSSVHILLGYIIQNRPLQKDDFGNLFGGIPKFANPFNSFQKM